MEATTLSSISSSAPFAECGANPAAAAMLLRLLELGVARGAREGNHVADVGHAGHELDEALEAQAKTGVGRAAVATEIEVPPVFALREPLFAQARLENR